MLSYTCTSLKDIAYKRIYKEISISPRKSQAKKGTLAILHKSLSNPHIASLVITFRFHISHFSLCGRDRVSFNRQRQCICKEWDQKFAAVVIGMYNLRDLDIQQFISHDTMEGWGSVLSHLTTNRLQRLRFKVHNLAWREVINFKQLLLEPHMKSLEALYIPSRLFPFDEDAGVVLLRPDVLPNLTSICDDESPNMPYIYQNRKITRVILTWTNSSTPRHLRNSQTNLTHLSTETPNAGLLSFVTQNLDIFMNLRHLGILFFEDDSIIEILLDMALLSPLPKLSSVEFYTHFAFRELDVFFNCIRIRLPTIFQFFYNGKMWRFYGGRWKPVHGSFTSWEVVNKEVVEDMPLH
ncbi:hypothetical protein FRC20_011590 [Serendipita sp. 405]|nr:hypothetical protein FRC20_011590 [Serendipita sp. 405]